MRPLGCEVHRSLNRKMASDDALIWGTKAGKKGAKLTGMLQGYRVLDLTDHRTQYCGKLLADLGCDVVKIEKPGGDSARNIGPFHRDIPHPERSLFWFANNLGKKSITLDIASRDGSLLFKALAQSAAVVIDSFSPGHMESLGLGYSTIERINPRIIMASITPFGQQGPYRDLQGPDIVVSAMSGFMYLHGEADRPPLNFSIPQAFLHASIDAVQAIVIALHSCEITERGQSIDVSAQESMVWMIMASTLSWLENGQVICTREGNVRTLPNGVRFRWSYQCKDGFIFFFLLGGHIGARTNRALVQWMNDEGVVDDYLRNMNWEGWDFAGAKQEEVDRIEGAFGKLFLNHTKEELYTGAHQRGILLGPVWSVEDWDRSPQLESRDFWMYVDHPELGEVITYPGTCYQSSVFPKMPSRRAPFIGEHNQEIFVDELGIDPADVIILRQAGVI